VERLVVQYLDQPAENGVAGVAVGEHRAGREELLGAGEGGDEPRDGVAGDPGAGEQVAVDAAGVGEQVAGGHGIGRGRVAQSEIGHIGNNRTI
jgi:hypothetical protein